MGARMHAKLWGGIASVTLIGGCSQFLGLEGWTDPPGTGGASSSSSSSAGGGAGGADSAGGATASSPASSASSGSFVVDSGMPTCFDGTLDGTESDVDCGGDDCPPCRAGYQCHDGADCASGTCSPDGTCAAEAGPSPCEMGPDATCHDCRKDGLETDVDCGGDACLPCGATKGCIVDGDCLSAHCASGVCTAGAVGKPCRQGTDCGSGDCAVGACFTGSCCH